MAAVVFVDTKAFQVPAAQESPSVSQTVSYAAAPAFVPTFPLLVVKIFLPVAGVIVARSPSFVIVEAAGRRVRRLVGSGRAQRTQHQHPDEHDPHAPDFIGCCLTTTRSR